jgi:hypothetical protein
MDCQALALAIQEIAAHPAVRGPIKRMVEGNRATIEFGLDLDFGDRWRAEGQSPNGVKAEERVRFSFDRDFPVTATVPSLRPDFSREHAHVQPGLTPDGRVIPCVVDGPLDEFVAANGLYGLVDQTWRWLMNAGVGDLVNGAAFWEPMRRDGVRDLLFANWPAVDSQMRGGAGFAVLPCAVSGRTGDPEALKTYRGRALGQRIAGAVVARFLKGAVDDRKQGVALVLWPDRKSETGEEHVEGDYEPDSVATFADLEAMAARFGMAAPLKAGLAALGKAAAGVEAAIPLPIILLVRRPRHLQGSDSPIEHIGYLATLALPAAHASEAVRPLACFDDLSPSLLRRLSGEAKAPAWGLLGAGSLGSKIAMHRARSGAAPEFVIDPKWLQSHNAARHALHANPAEDLHQAWLDPKAVALSDAIGSLAQTTKAVRARHPAILQVMADPETSKLAWLLNTTASVVVRDWLGGPEGQAAPRGAEAGLFDAGGLGYLAFEGVGRNPDSLDLMGALYALARRRPRVAAAVFKAEGQLGAVRIGEGCASTTMVMSDARLSAMAAPMAELIAAADPDAEAGVIHLLLRDGVGLTHEAIPVGAHARLSLEGLEGWTVSLSPSVEAAITAEAADYPASETGGVLLGRASMIARRIQVVEILPAPIDSKRSATEFVLGVEGLTDTLTAIGEETAAALVCVGTWHSHLGSAAPSAQDRFSAGIVGQWEARPMVFLIRGMDGWRAVSAASPLVAEPARRRRGGRNAG